MGENFYARRGDVVFDHYVRPSIQDEERQRRAPAGHQVIKITRPDQHFPCQIDKFLASWINKHELIEFVASEWMLLAVPNVLSEIELVVAHGKLCESFICDVNGKVEVTSMESLQGDYEEAKTRMFLHAQQAATMGKKNVLIQRSDSSYLHSQLSCDLTVISRS